MELRNRYKQTEIGVIPADWDVKYIGEISDVKTGPFGSALHEKDYVDNGTPIITVEHLGEYGVDHINLPMISDTDKTRLKSYMLDMGDIVFSRVGSIDRNALIREREAGWLFSGRLLRVRIFNGKHNSKYLSYHFHFEPFKLRVRAVAVGQTMPSLNTEILKGIKVALPSKAEQIAIANALSDADAWIQALNCMIEKKRQIKQGAMQTLLNPYKNGRLKKGWVVNKLGKICNIEMGQSPSSRNYNNKSIGLPLVQGNADIKNRKTIIRVYTSEVTRRCQSGDIIMSVRAPVGEIAIASFDACIGRGVCAIRYSNEYIFYYLIYTIRH